MMFMKIWKTIIQQRKGEMLILFDDITPHMKSNELLSLIATELFLRGRKLNISFVFISQFYFKVLKTLTLNAAHYFTMKMPNKREIQQIVSNLIILLIWKISWNFIKVILKNHFHFQWTTRLCHQVIH